MSWNREKVVFLLAVLIAALGTYRMTVTAIGPSREFDLRPVTLVAPETPRPPKLGLELFHPGSLPSRNPFNFSEGWQRLEPEPLPPPPRPGPELMLPYLGDVRAGAEGVASFLFVERPASATSADDEEVSQ